MATILSVFTFKTVESLNNFSGSAVTKALSLLRKSDHGGFQSSQATSKKYQCSMEMVPSPLNLQDKWVGPVQKIKTHMSFTRNEEEEVKKSVSKADVLGYFTSLINKRKKKQQRILKCTKKEKRAWKHADNFDLFIKYADLCCSCLYRF